MAFSPSQMVFNMKAADTSRARVEGRFASAQKELAAENRRTATVAQAFVVRDIQSSYKRPSVATGRLAKVTAAEANIAATAFYIGVGKPSYLDSSQARYWRTIEQGSAATWKKRSFLTLDLLGVFGATNSGGRAGPRYTLPGQATGGKFRPIRADRETGEARFGRVTLRHFHPRHEIQAMGAYARAYEQAQFAAKGVNAARKYLDTVLGA